jgi:hypothetical protein
MIIIIFFVHTGGGGWIEESLNQRLILFFTFPILTLPALTSGSDYFGNIQDEAPCQIVWRLWKM